MSDEEATRIRQIVRDELSQLANNQAADNIRITRLEETAQTLLGITQNLITLAASHDARMDSLVRTVDRYITARGSNGAGGDQ